MSFSGEFGMIPEDIMYLLSEGEKAPMMPGTHQTNGKFHNTDNVRDTTISWVNTDNAFNIMMPFVEAANDLAGWKYDLREPEGVQIAQYIPGQHYTWHIDGESDNFAAREFIEEGTSDHNGALLLNQTNKKQFDGLVRKLSVVA